MKYFKFCRDSTSMRHEARAGKHVVAALGRIRKRAPIRGLAQPFILAHHLQQ
jgi:hypothetical protein